MLALTFKSGADYERIRENDTLDILGLDTFTPGVPLKAVLRHADGTLEVFEVNHSYTSEQVEWFKAGSALNRLRAEEAGHPAPSRA
jgi:aconitate hydratase